MTILTTIDGSIAVIELNRPAAMNALSERLLVDLNLALDEVSASNCRGVVFVGSGSKAFCAGADINELRHRSLDAHRANSSAGQSTFNRISALSAPSVAVIHGFAFGGGLELALACTFRIGTRNAKMGLPEVKLGLIPAYGGTQRLPRLIGEARALDLILSGRTIGADEALQAGLINSIVATDHPAQAGKEFLAQYSQVSLSASNLARAAVQRGLDGGLGAGLAIETDAFALSTQASDAAEGLAAFLEKRQPRFGDANGDGGPIL